MISSYAKQHRYRTRNLHDGRPVPPCLIGRSSKRVPNQAFGNAEDRCDAIVGHQGYVFAQDGKLEIYLCYKSALGVNRAIERIEAMGGEVTQAGDIEVAGWVPISAIEDVCRLVKAARRPKGGPGCSAARMATVRAAQKRGSTPPPATHNGPKG